MKYIPRMFTALCVATLASLTAFATPNPKWVPASSDVVFTADGLDIKNPEAEKVWKDGLEKLGIATGNSLESIKEIEAEVPGFENLIKVAFGLSDDLMTTATKSITLACTIVKEKDSDDLDKSSIVFVVENPKADLNALEAAIRKVLESKPDDDILLAREGEWLTLKQKDDDDNLIAICKVEEGYLTTIQPTLQDAEAIRTGKTPAIDAANPLMAAFAPRATDVDGKIAFLVKNLSDLINRFASPETITQIQMQQPALLKTQTVTFGGETRGTKTDVKLNFKTDDAATAQQMLEAFLGYKMLAQMMGVGIFNKPDAKTLAFISSIACKADGENTSLSFSITPEVFFPIIEEIQELQKQAEQPGPDVDVDIDLGDLDDEDEDEDETPMSPEEAKAILDALDVE